MDYQVQVKSPTPISVPSRLSLTASRFVATSGDCFPSVGSFSSFSSHRISGSSFLVLHHSQLRKTVPIRPHSAGFLIAQSLESSSLAAIVAITTFSAAWFNHELKKNSLGNEATPKDSTSLIQGINQLRQTLVDQVIWNLLADKFHAPNKRSLSVTVNGTAVGNVHNAVQELESCTESVADGELVESGSIRSHSRSGQISQISSSQNEEISSLGWQSATGAFPLEMTSDGKLDPRSLFKTPEELPLEDLYTFFGVQHQDSSTSAIVDSDFNVFSDASTSKAYSSKSSDLKLNIVSKSQGNIKKSTVQNAAHGGTKVPELPPTDDSSNKTEKSGKRKTSRTAKTSEHNIHEDVKDHRFDVYNDLLRVGRLSECIDLLEHLEQKGQLDINKVYHADFFKLCRRKNATQIAFRFFKLIPNPTLSTFNMLMSVCASSRDADGAFQVLQLLQRDGLKADCKIYTTLISSCAKSGKVDTMFEVFHEMVNSGVEPNVHTYGALIDGCARVGQVAKAFGAYGIMRSKNVKPDRAVFNALISACGQSGAVDRAFDVLTEMSAETQPVDPDHCTIGALMMACAKAGQVDRVLEVYNMVRKYDIKGTTEMYTIAVNCCSQTKDWNLACLIYDDMIERGVVPDEIFFSALIDVAGHAGKVDAAFDVLKRAKTIGSKIGVIPYSSLMGACSNSKNWQKALELYDDMKSINLKPTVPTFNALITSLCNADQLPKAMETLFEMRDGYGLRPNTVTYSMLLVACERMDDLKAGAMLLSLAKEDGVLPNIVMHKCIIGMCLHRFEKASTLGEPVLSVGLDRPKIQNEWSSLALKVYREAIVAGQKPTMDLLSQVLGCLKLPYDAALKTTLFENMGVGVDLPRSFHFRSLLEGFGEYDSRAFFLLEEAASSGIVPYVSFKENPIVVDAKKLQIHITEVYLLTILKGLKHHLAAGGKLPNLTVLLPLEKSEIMTSKGQKTVNLATRNGQSVASLLRRIGIPYKGSESRGHIRINGICLRRWLQPRTDPPWNKKPEESGSSLTRIGRIISNQQRSIRTGNLSLD